MSSAVKMQRGRSTDRDAENALAEAELLKLQRQYRAAEGGRKAYAEETQAQLRKQAAQIEQLEKDSKYLTEELAMAEGSAADLQKNVERARELEVRLDGYQAEINNEKSRCADLDKLILNANKELREARLSAKSGGAAAPDAAAVAKRVHTMENRVEKANRKVGTVLVANAALRARIENLRQERLVFANIHAKLEKQLAGQKREMALVVERSNQAYEQRDDIQTRLVALQERATKETAQYDNEIKELTRALEHDRKLKSFMGVKGQDRGKSDPGSTRRRAVVDRDRTPEESLRVYEQAFRKIKDSTGIEDLTKLVDRFIEVEDQNFSLYNFVNELNRETETLREQIQSLQRQIALAGSENESGDARRKAKLQELEGRLATSQAEASAFEEQLSAHKTEFDALKAGVAAIFEQIGCDPAAVADALGSAEVTEGNIMQYLRVIEDRTNQLLRLRAVLDTHASEDWERREAELRDHADAGFDPAATLGPKPQPRSLLGAGPAPAPRPPAAVPVPAAVPAAAGADDDSDDFDDVDLSKPLTQEELRARALRKTLKAAHGSGSSRAGSGQTQRRPKKK